MDLTLPNVMGFDAVMHAIQKAWASPFTERAFAWRQAHLEQPEHVYPAVLLLQTFAAEKSGVRVTSDIETGNRQWLSIAISEAVGGAVEGQAAEELRVHRCAQNRSPAAACIKCWPVAVTRCYKHKKSNSCAHSSTIQIRPFVESTRAPQSVPHRYGACR